MNALGFDLEFRNMVQNPLTKKMEVSPSDCIVLLWLSGNEIHVLSKTLRYGIFLCLMLGEQGRHSFSNGRSQEVREKYDELIQKRERNTWKIWRINEERETMRSSSVECMVLQNMESTFIKHSRKCSKQAHPDKPSITERGIFLFYMWNRYIFFIFADLGDWKSIL